jgi:uncharacterized membrane protein YagU involved in acid resistance
MRHLAPIALGGVLAGVLDILAAFAMSWPRVTPARVLQSIASGLLGRAAYQGGARTAALGLLLHFVIAFGAAAVYYAASRRLPLLRRRPVACGLAYGVAVYLVMNLVVLPLSQIGFRLPPWPTIALLVVIHMICVGLPIALAAARARVDAVGS